eukprot:10588-Pelagomonas_calceolata.AAC.1
MKVPPSDCRSCCRQAVGVYGYTNYICCRHRSLAARKSRNGASGMSGSPAPLLDHFAWLGHTRLSIIIPPAGSN